MLFTILLQKVNIKFRPFAKHFFLLALFFLARLFFCGAPSFSQTLAGARLYLADCTLQVIKNAMKLVLVPYLEKM